MTKANEVKWKRPFPDSPNVILEGPEVGDAEFIISYNPSPGQGFSLFTSDNHDAETALRLCGKWFILNGDFRQEYEQAFPNPFECLAVYDKHKAQRRSTWSTDEFDEEDVKKWLAARLKSIAEGD